MPMYLPGGDVVAPEWAELARKLTHGDGLGWSGDPRLWMQIGVMEEKYKGRVVRTGRRIEVWRQNEDGSETMISHWLPSEQHRIPFDLARMRPESPGFVSAIDRIERNNRKKEQEASERFQGVMTEMLTYAARLHADRTGPRETFYLGGRDAARA